MGTPNSSATICAAAVSCPCPLPHVAQQHQDAAVVLHPAPWPASAAPEALRRPDESMYADALEVLGSSPMAMPDAEVPSLLPGLPLLPQKPLVVD